MGVPVNILVADDDAVYRRLLELKLSAWGYHPTICADGTEALERLSESVGPPLAILDWMMPGLKGPEVCSRERAAMDGSSRYLILLTGKSEGHAIVEGLRSGADDYITKPFDDAELEARVAVGARVVGLQDALARRLSELQNALDRVRQLQGLLPICAYCKRVRDDRDYWSQVETYVSARADVSFSHGVCPDCFERVLKEDFGAPDASDA